MGAAANFHGMYGVPQHYTSRDAEHRFYMVGANPRTHTKCCDPSVENKTIVELAQVNASAASRAMKWREFRNPEPSTRLQSGFWQCSPVAAF